MSDTDFFTDSERLKPLPQSDFKKLLEQRETQKGHNRKQKLLDALSNIALVAVYVLPAVLALFYLVVLGHKAKIGQWDILEADIKSLLIPVTTYLIGLLSKNVLTRNNDN